MNNLLFKKPFFYIKKRGYSKVVGSSVEMISFLKAEEHIFIAVFSWNKFPTYDFLKKFSFCN